MFKKILKYTFLTVFWLGLIGAISGIGYSTYYITQVINPQLPEPKMADLFEVDNQIITTIKDRYGNVVEKVNMKGNQIIISSDKIPKSVKDAFVSVEDKRFYEHNGIDFIRIAGAMLKNIKSKEMVQGASTITQQLAGMTYLDRAEKSLDRKIKEAVLAWKMERELNKDAILTAYINNIYYGVGKSGKICYGIEAAANDYFGKHAENLTLGEAALLAGIVNNPTQASPIINPEGAKERRDTVLFTMKENDFISEEDYQKALKEPIKVSTIIKPDKELKKENYSYIDEVVLQTMDIMDLKEIKDFYSSGVTVETYLDQDKQKFLYDYLNNDYLFSYQDQAGIQASATIKNNLNGSVIAMFGGRKAGDIRFGFNRATMGFRQPGSAIKPIAVYAPAFALGKFDTGSIVEDEEIELETPDGKDTHIIKNADGRYHGDVTIREAIVQSYNPVAVKVLDITGISNSLQFTKVMGLEHLIVETSEEKNDVNLTTALGGLTKGTTTSEMATAYSVFPNNGIKKDVGLISSIKDKNGKEIYSYKTKDSEKILSKEVCYMISSTLKDVVDKGTGVSARQIDGRPFYGKTGTTDEYKDIWFAGYTTDYSIAVWIGYDNPKPISSNSLLAAELAGTIAYNISRNLPIKFIEKPDKVKTYITKTGKVELYSEVDSTERIKLLAEEKQEKERKQREKEQQKLEQQNYQNQLRDQKISNNEEYDYTNQDYINTIEEPTYPSEDENNDTNVLEE